MEKINVLHIGQPIFYRLLSGRLGDDISLKESTITSVGKKYFRIDSLPYAKFFIDSLLNDGGNYSSEYQAYLSEQDYNDEVETRKLKTRLRDIFHYNGGTDIELSKLRAIINIINS